MGAIYMGKSGNNKGELRFMTLGSMNKVARKIWGSIPMPDTIIARVNALVQGQHNDPQFLDRKNRPIRELDITGVDDGWDEAPHIEFV